MKHLFYLISVLFLFCISCNNNAQKGSPSTETIEIISNYIQEAKNEKLLISERRDNLDKAYGLLKETNNDTVQKEIYLDIIHGYYLLRDTANFKKLNKELLSEAKKTKDSATIAKCLWRFGNYYSNIKKNNDDSAYYYFSQSERIYSSLGDEKKVAMLLLNMAVIQKNAKDYTGSEVTTTKAIAILKPLKEYFILYSCYNNLGIIFNELENYDKALYYHEKAFTYLDKADTEHLKPVTLNNIGVILHNQEKYSTAISNYKKALEFDDLLESNPRLYAMLFDNLAYAQLKSEKEPVEYELFLEALKIRDSLKFNSGITINKLHLAEFYLSRRDTVTALGYLREAKELSEESNNFRDLLASLLMMADISRGEAVPYLKEVVRISDSLQKEERTIRNKFARIRFETDEYITETKRLSQRVMRISLTTLGIIILFILLYMIKDQRSKNKLISQKQKGNKEIYNLILAQKQHFEEGREKEKQHISRELHDGILGKLFGVRMSLDSLNDEDDPDSKKKRYECVEEIQKIAEEIRLVSHKLNKSSIVDVDFRTVLEELVQKQNNGKITFTLKSNSVIDWEAIENDVKINIFRIIQESISNIHKHSAATKALISLDKEANKLIVQIADNGIGFSLTEVKKGIGLKNIQVRARSINAKAIFKSSGKGTRIEVFVPV